MNDKTNNPETNAMGLEAACIPLPLSPNSTTTEENSRDPNYLKVQRITRKRPYFVMIAYYKSFDVDDTRGFIAAAEFKKKRLKEKYPEAYVDEVKKITTKDDFVNAWNEINDFLTGQIMGYELREVHFFGHSSFKDLNFYRSELKGDDVDQLPQLPWSKHVGTAALVLHSCRSSRFEDQEDRLQQALKKSIANDLSISQGVRVIGQVVYATNNTGDTLGEWMYRNSSSVNKRLIDEQRVSNIVLWGYCAGAINKLAYWSLWPGSEDQNLKDMQIWPCRGFIMGTEYARIVKKEVFNKFDLTYI